MRQIRSQISALRSTFPHERKHAATALRILASSNAQNRDAIIEAGGIAPFVGLLTDEMPKVRREAAMALAWLAFNDQNRDTVREAGGLALLVGLLIDADDTVREHSAKALGNLAYSNAQNQNAIREVGGLAPLVGLLTDADHTVRRQGARVLSNLAHNAQNRDAIREAGGLALLVGLLTDADHTVRCQSAGVLSNLAHNAQNRDAIREAGGIAPLVRLLTDADDTVRGYSAKALGKLAASNAQNRDAIREAGGLAPLVGLLIDVECLVRLVAVRVLTYLALNAQNRDAIREAGGVAPLVVLLTDTDLGVKQNAAEALSILAAFNAQNQDAIREAGGIAPLVRLLTDADLTVRQNAACSLRILATSNAQNRDAIREAGGVAPLVVLLTDTDLGVKQNAAKALSTLANSNAQNQDAIREVGGIAPLVRLLTDADLTVRQNAACSLAWLSHNAQNKGTIREAGGVAPLVRLLADADLTVRGHAASALGNLAVNDQTQDAIREAGGLVTLVGLLADAHFSVRGSAAYALSTLANSNAQNQDAIREAGGLIPLVLLLTDADLWVRQQAACALGNLAYPNASNQEAIATTTGCLKQLMILSRNEISIMRLYTLFTLLKLMLHCPINAARLMDAGVVDALLHLRDDDNARTPIIAELALAQLICRDERDARLEGIEFNIALIIRGLDDLTLCSKDCALGILAYCLTQGLYADTLRTDAVHAQVEALAAHECVDVATQAQNVLALLRAPQADLQADALSGGGGGAGVRQQARRGLNHIPKAAAELQPVTKYRSALAQQVITRAQGDLAMPAFDSLAASRAAQMESGGGGAKPEVLPIPAGAGMIPFAELTYDPATDFIADGAFGKVYKATWHGAPVALKLLSSQNIRGAVLAELQHESAMMTELRHPNIVDFFGACMEPGHYGLVMAFMENGSLNRVLADQRVELDWPKRYKISGGIANGIGFLHSKHILHRDLKSLNVLVDATYTPKLADFGLSKIKTDSVATTAGGPKGTLLWMAPEILIRGGQYTPKADIYSFGVILFEIASRQMPWADAQAAALIPLWVQQGQREDIPAETPKPFATLITKCWAQKPEARPAIAEVVAELAGIQEAVMP